MVTQTSVVHVTQPPECATWMVLFSAPAIRIAAIPGQAPTVASMAEITAVVFVAVTNSFIVSKTVTAIRNARVNAMKQPSAISTVTKVSVCATPSVIAAKPLWRRFEAA